MKDRGRLCIVLLWVALIALSSVSVLDGSVWIHPGDLLGNDASAHLARLIMTELRLPRLVLTLLVGGTLGLSGAMLQGLTRNPLAEPSLLGISAGAAFGAVLSIYFGLATHFPAATPVMGLLGAGLAMALTFTFGRGGGTLTLILAGAAVTALMWALTELALNLADNVYAAYEMAVWLLGTLADRSWEQVELASPFILVGALIMVGTGRSLDALSLGEAQAESLGVNLERLNRRVLIGTALAVGAATSVTGEIGFVGLIAPHLVRPLMGHQPGRLLWPSALAGALLLLAADLATRVVSFGPDIKVGVFTALVGAPFFFYLIVRMRRTTP